MLITIQALIEIEKRNVDFIKSYIAIDYKSDNIVIEDKILILHDGQSMFYTKVLVVNKNIAYRLPLEDWVLTDNIEEVIDKTLKWYKSYA